MADISDRFFKQKAEKERRLVSLRWYQYMRAGYVAQGIGAARPFTPLDLDPNAWYDPSNIGSLFQDSGGTTEVTAVNQPVGRASDLSGNGLNATQAIAANRPTYARNPSSGIRNLLDNSDTLSGWTESRGTLTVSGDLVRLLPNSGQDGLVNEGLPSSAPDNTELTFSLVASAAEYNGIRFTGGSGFSEQGPFEVNLSDGSIVSGSPDVVDLGGGRYRISTQITYSGSGNRNLNIIVQNNGSDVSGDGTSAILIGQTQVEVGATSTAYQNRVNQFDIIQSGDDTLFYLADDQINDELTVTLPDLGSNATEFYADENGATINGGLTIGAGSRSLPNSARLYSYGLIDRALSAADISRLTAYLNVVSGQ